MSIPLGILSLYLGFTGGLTQLPASIVHNKIGRGLFLLRMTWFLMNFMVHSGLTCLRPTTIIHYEVVCSGW
jgi:hypothetical protein